MLDSPCTDRRQTTTPITVTLPNGDYIVSTHHVMLPFLNFPGGALEAHLFPQLHGQALLSIGVFCDVGCTAAFSANSVKIEYNGKIVLEGTRQPLGLWKTKLTKAPHTAWMANAAHTATLKTNAIMFIHTTCFSPTTQTWTNAIKHGFFRSIPLLNEHNVSQHLPKSMATAKGHLDQH